MPIVTAGSGQPNPASDFRTTWFPIEEFDAGGGGKVYRCVRLSLLEQVKQFNLQSGSISLPETTRNSICARLIDEINQHLVLTHDGLAAVKVPHASSDASAIQRFQREIEAMNTCKHPSLIKLIDHGPVNTLSWFSMEYHPNGNLEDHAEFYKEKPLECLLAMRPIIEGTALLHRNGFIHRDIKPKNIFVSSEEKLILGDLGIVFPSQEEGDRLTRPGQTLVSRDWIPDWIRFNDDPPEQQVDVFMLSKVMYFMVSGGRKVVASQLDEPSHSLETLFPSVPEMKNFQEMLRSCITLHKRDCKVADAGKLLEVVDQLIDVFSDKARTQLLFSFISTHSTTELIIVRPDNEGSQYPRLKDIQVFLPFTCRRFLARASIISPGNEHEVTSTFVVDGQRSEAVITRLPRTDPGSWSDEIVLRPSTPIKRGWCTLAVNVTSPVDGGRITGFMLYGE
jgi:serine/threonine protein kinase